jgi:hypothetical protein
MDFATPPVGSPEFRVLHAALGQYVANEQEHVAYQDAPEQAVLANLQVAESMLERMDAALAALAS